MAPETITNISDEVRDALVAKCQENGWLKIGGYDWQDDPYLEDYPYSFSLVEDIEDLRSAFASGNWAIRQGFVYEDLAFIQQVNVGDEWWTLKLAGDGTSPEDWVDFESWTFRPSANYSKGAKAAVFTNYIRSMQMATPRQCEMLAYMIKGESPAWNFSKTVDLDFDHKPVECRSFKAETPDYLLSVYERPSYPGFSCELFDKREKCVLDMDQGLESALDAANSLLEKAKICKEHDIHTPEKLRDSIPLELKAALATQCARHVPHPDRSIDQSRGSI